MSSAIKCVKDSKLSKQQGSEDLENTNKPREFMAKYKKLSNTANKHILRTRVEGSNHARSLRSVARF